LQGTIYILQGMVIKYFSCTFLLFKNATNLSLLGIMRAVPPLAKSPLISSYGSKNVWPKLAWPTSQNDLQLLLLLMGGGCILSISPCQPCMLLGAFSIVQTSFVQ